MGIARVQRRNGEGTSGLWCVFAVRCALIVALSVLFSPLQLALAEDEGYIGSKACAECHAKEYERWQGSHHDLAMQEASESSMLGDFNDATFENFGTLSTFYRKDGQFMVRTDGPDGRLHDYAIAYTFGVDPLQQYLIAFPGGRYQALDIAWDSRPQEEGGQRWFHLHPETPVRSDDVLHWTGPNLNWNYMCASCHSTNLKKGYRERGDIYDTTWSEIDVGCEACHGPGAAHQGWAVERAKEKLAPEGTPAAAAPELSVRFDERKGVAWLQDEETGKPRRSQPRVSNIEVETCARCHSRRSQLGDMNAAGHPFADDFRLALLEPGLYYPDGQVRDEVYVVGSFLQSRMAQAGVICSDCHDPHDVKLRLPDSNVCAQCHAPNRYDQKSHHFHPEGSAGVDCVSCHMPATIYMGVDDRHDHSLRFPRPDLTQRMGVPDPCTGCHVGRTPSWAISALEEWYGKSPQGHQRFAPALFASATQQVGARRAMVALASAADQPAIARATALGRLFGELDPESLAVLQKNLGSEEAMLREAALEGLEGTELGLRWRLASPLLEDERRVVRIRAARALAPAASMELPPAEAAKLRRAIDEYIAVQRYNAERPESQVNLGGIYAELGNMKEAEVAYRRALVLQRQFVPAYVNFADLLGRSGREAEGEALLRRGISEIPQNADLIHALGLSIVRQERLADALEPLCDAHRLAPDNARYGYVCAVALHSTGRGEEALNLLAEVHESAPGDVAVLQALVAYHRDAGNLEASQRYRARLEGLRSR